VEQVTEVKKAQYMIFSSPISLGLVECNLASHVVHILLNVKTVFHFLKSTFIQFCDAKLRLWGKHAEWPMTDYFFKHLASSLLKVNCGEIVFWLSFKICYELWIFSNAWNTFYMISAWILSVGVPLSNQNFFVNTSNWSNIKHISSRFEVYWRWWSPQFFFYMCEKTI
jgi:hypothetical protein